MSVARFAEKKRKCFRFFDADPTVLYRMVALPYEAAAKLAPDTLLTDPKTGRGRSR